MKICSCTRFSIIFQSYSPEHLKIIFFYSLLSLELIVWCACTPTGFYSQNLLKCIRNNINPFFNWGFRENTRNNTRRMGLPLNGPSCKHPNAGSLIVQISSKMRETVCKRSIRAEGMQLYLRRNASEGIIKLHALIAFDVRVFFKKL